jgi:WD40 repeat protein
MLASGDEGGAIELWRPDGAPLARIASGGGQVNGLAFAPDGGLLASAGHDGAVRIWRVPSGAPAGELRAGEGPALALAFAPGGGLLASAGYDGSVRLWRMPAGALERTIVALESDGMSDTSILQLAFAPDGASLALAGHEGAVSIWRVADGALVERRPVADAAWLGRVAYRSDGGLLARDDGGRVLAWPAGGGAPEVLAGPAVGELAALPSGDLATLGDASIQIWRPAGGKLARYADATAMPATSLAAGPGLLALGSRTGAIEIWAVR